MVLPIGDAPNPRGLPVATYALIAINVAVYVLITLPQAGVRADPGDPLLAEYARVMQHALGDDPAELRAVLARVSVYDLFVFRWGFRPDAPSAVDLFTSMFLHGGLFHLAGNMLFLWIYGDNVEHRIGPTRFVAWYLVTGVAATLFHMAGDSDSPIPMVGASGAISGILGFYFVWFPRNHVRLLWLLPPLAMQVFEVPSRLVLGLYLVMENVLPYLLARDGAGIAHGAHIGGFVAGVAIGWLLDRRELREQPAEYTHGPDRRAGAEGPPDIGAAVDVGRYDDAATRYFRLSPERARGVLTPAQSLALAEWLAQHGHAQAAVVVARRHLRDFARGPGIAEAHLLAGEGLLEENQPTAAYQHFVAALDADPPQDVAAIARRAIASIESLQKPRGGRPGVRRLG